MTFPDNVDRILDAAANRCREGLRVVEDFVRFVLDDAHLTRLLKEVRHELKSTLDLLPIDRLLAARDRSGDVGENVKTAAERQRDGSVDVVRANCKRVEESLRTLEEYSKTLDNGEDPGGRVRSGADGPAMANAAERFEHLRYEFYSIEQAVLQTLRARERLAHARLYLLVTKRLCAQEMESVVRLAVFGGVRMVQLREKDLSDRDLLELARSVRQWTTEAGALFIVNDRPDMAVACGADGVHLGQDDMPVSAARRIVGDKLIGVSTHTIEQGRQAVRDGADYLGVGPVFPSQTKSFDEFPGLDLVRQVAAEISLPWFPLGGIDESNISDVLACGATRVAVSGAISSTADPATLAKRLASFVN